MGLTFNLGRDSAAVTSDASLNVGIGGAPSGSYKFEVAGSGKFSGNVTLDNVTNPTLRLNGAVGGSPTIRLDQNGVNKGWMYLTSGGVLQINNDATDGKGIALNGNNVGIGTTSPTVKTHIYNSGDGYNMLMAEALGGDAGLALKGGNGSSTTGGWTIQSQYSGNLIFVDRNSTPTERMRITSGGEVLINRTSSANSVFKLQVEGRALINGNQYALLITTNSGSSGMYLGADVQSSNTNLLFTSGTSGGTLSYINGSTGGYVSVSDINKKKDFEESTIGLNAILGLKPTLFRFIDDKDNESEKELGFIAQEVKEFIPQAYKENGTFIGLQDRPIIAVLVKAIQEQNEIITKQGQAIEELKNKIN